MAKIHRLDSRLAISVETMTEVLNESLAARRFNTFLLSAFASVALLLAAVGLYGVISCSVTQQIHEIGIRMALGAARKNVVRMIVARGLALTILGEAIGAAAAFGFARSIAGMLYDVPPTDAWTYIGVAFILMAAAFLAAYIPSRRAARVDPMTALRCE
jgi:ABC-type antimicrobial peptide transport system permease subunit